MLHIDKYIPHPSTVSRRIKYIEQDKREKLKKLLSKELNTLCPAISFTTDIWLEPHKCTSWIALSLHFIDNTYNYLSCILDCIEFKTIIKQHLTQIVTMIMMLNKMKKLTLIYKINMDKQHL